MRIEEINIITDERREWYAPTMEEAKKRIEDMKKKEENNNYCDYLIFEVYSIYIPDEIILSEFTKSIQRLGTLEHEIYKMSRHNRKLSEKLKELFKSMSEKYEICTH